MSAWDYCEGYCHGFDEAREFSVLREGFSDDHSEDYRDGFRRGFAAKRIMEGGTDSETKARRILYEEVERMEGYYGDEGPKPTDEHWEYWRSLQSKIRQNGSQDWKDILAETYRLLSDYAAGARATLSDYERSDVQHVQEVILKRLAKTLGPH